MVFPLLLLLLVLLVSLPLALLDLLPLIVPPFHPPPIPSLLPIIGALYVSLPPRVDNSSSHPPSTPLPSLSSVSTPFNTPRHPQTHSIRDNNFTFTPSSQSLSTNSSSSSSSSQSLSTNPSPSSDEISSCKCICRCTDPEFQLICDIENEGGDVGGGEGFLKSLLCLCRCESDCEGCECLKKGERIKEKEKKKEKQKEKKKKKEKDVEVEGIDFDEKDFKKPRGHPTFYSSLPDEITAAIVSCVCENRVPIRQIGEVGRKWLSICGKEKLLV